MAADTYEKLKRDFEGAFSGAAGFGALQQKDYPNAQKYLGAAVQANPDDLQNVYPLAVAYLQTTPLNPLGFWYGARAIHLSANNAAAIPPKLMPKVGGEVGLQAAPVSYDKSPYLLHMGEGKLLVSKAAPGARRKPPVRRRRPAR